MIIKNYKELATSPLRRAALDIIEAGLNALQSEHLIRGNVSVAGSEFRVQAHTFDLSRFSHIFVVGIGKASVGMGKAFEDVLRDRITGGYILDRKQGHFRKLTSLVGTHPDPSQQNVEATREILDFLSGADAKTLVIVLISGGGSALLTAPFKITVDKKAAIARSLMNSGATIQELNIVRKHLSEVKGGQLAKIAYPATVVSLILSDVPGDDLATIASGPTVPDATTIEQATKILEKYKVKQVAELKETTKDEKYFERVTNILLATASSAFPSMQEAARRHGLISKILSDHLTGEADEVGRDMLRKVRRGQVLLATGETTVTVRGKGVGGRNQQLVLSTLPSLKEGQLVASIGTDGHDNTDHAGAIGDRATVQKAGQHKLDPQKYAQNNDSYTFFRLVGDGLETGELESNFADLMLCLWEK